MQIAPARIWREKLRTIAILIFLAGVNATLTGCASSENARLETASAEVGRQSAGINLPEWPQYCREPMPTVIPKLDEPVWGSQRRWEITRENDIKRDAWCADFYGSVRAEFGAAKQ